MFDSFSVSELTYLFRSGKPFHTGAVLDSLLAQKKDSVRELPHFKIEQNDSSTKLIYALQAEDRVYGLGQMLGGLNKRGKRYRLFAKDDPSHTPEKASLYGSHPFCIIQGPKTFGLFLDFPGELIFDVGFRDKDTLEIEVPSINFDLYLFEHWDMREIIRDYLKLTGKPYLPPRWAFGYQQCRYSYPDAETVSNVASKFRSLDIPCDAIYLDIDYMQDYKIFTVDPERFPDLKRLVAELSAQGFKTIPIIDPGVKIENAYPAYESGKAEKCFCTDENGKDFTGAVWPGLVHFPDFLNSKTRAWWGDLYKQFTDIGIAHFWNDMNEPAIFYTPESIEQKLRPLLKRVESSADLGKEAVDFIGSLGRFWQSEDDLKSFYHILDDGTRVCHWDVHNLYGYSMARATAEGLSKLLPDRRYFLVARSSYSGMQRFSVIWTGDNSSWWEHMLVQVRMMLSLNMAGFFYCGGDVGGFGNDSDAELCVRWTQLGCFSPLFRNHATKGSRQQEPWAFDQESLDIMRDFIKLRYALIPYAYSEYLRSIEELSPYLAPMFLHFGDQNLKDIEDQFMYGNSLMVAPILSQNARSRFVYLPECKWLHWNVSKWDQRRMQVLEPGSYRIEAQLSQLPLFIKENSLIAMHEPESFVGQKQHSELYLVGLVSDRAEFELLSDDGVSNAHERGEISKLRIAVVENRGKFEVDVQKQACKSVPIPYTSVKLHIFDRHGAVHSLEVSI